jgi:hypothetical protein
MSHASLQCFLSYRRQTETYRKFHIAAMFFIYILQNHIKKLAYFYDLLQYINSEP